MAYITRSLESRIRDALNVMPAVFVNGPRQAGKSTLARHLAGDGFDADYVTFDNAATFAAASTDPEAFLRAFARPAIIDEVQLVPGIFRALKLVIDEGRADRKMRANGRFLLTGSANVLALPDVSQALVGRMAVLTLYPLSASEVLGGMTPVIGSWFDGGISFSSSGKSRPGAVDTAIRRATFPEITRAAPNAASLWFGSYLTTLLQRDVKQLADIENVPALVNIVKVLAARAAGLLNDADCARDAKLNTMTYRRYRALLQQLFMIALVPAWHRNLTKRVTKAPKLFFTDTALLCHELGVDLGEVRHQNPPLFGRILENFVATELMKQLTALDDGALHHFRTTDGKEVDFVVERRNGRILGIEVKAAGTVGAADFAGLQTLQSAAGKDFARGIVLHLGRETLPFGDKLFAMPLDALWTRGKARSQA
jgi:hypothetical protein